jgi:hypothetical protein
MGGSSRRLVGPKKPAKPTKDRVWFERKVAELGTELEKLPAERRAELIRQIEDEADGKAKG